MCKILKVDRSSYYHWINNGSKLEKIDKDLCNLVGVVFFNSRRTYGTRRIKSNLLQNYGFIVSRRRITKVMKYLNISVKMKRRYKINTTDSNHDLPIAKNLINRDFYASYANEKYVGDITYIPTEQGWVYLATVIDLYSRKIVGWSMDDNMKTSLISNALKMAIKRRNPPSGLIFHSDRGSQYASYEYRDLLKKHEIKQSMSRKGNCWDNAVAESFFNSLKTELIYQNKFKTKAQANQAIFEYIEIFYNRQRLHSYNGNLSPVDYEEKLLRKVTVA